MSEEMCANQVVREVRQAVIDTDIEDIGDTVYIPDKCLNAMAAKVCERLEEAYEDDVMSDPPFIDSDRQFTMYWASKEESAANMIMFGMALAGHLKNSNSDITARASVRILYIPSAGTAAALDLTKLLAAVGTLSSLVNSVTFVPMPAWNAATLHSSQLSNENVSLAVVLGPLVGPLAKLLHSMLVNRNSSFAIIFEPAMHEMDLLGGDMDVLEANCIWSPSLKRAKRGGTTAVVMFDVNTILYFLVGNALVGERMHLAKDILITEVRRQYMHIKDAFMDPHGRVTRAIWDTLSKPPTSTSKSRSKPTDLITMDHEWSGPNIVSITAKDLEQTDLPTVMRNIQLRMACNHNKRALECCTGSSHGRVSKRNRGVPPPGTPLNDPTYLTKDADDLAFFKAIDEERRFAEDSSSFFTC
jgi:hypothetical protein